MLDGKDSSAFATKQAEAWHELGTEGDPALQPRYSQAGPVNIGGTLKSLNTPAFYKDPFGVVHLKGTVQNDQTAGNVVFTLPAGYRPAAVEMQGSLDAADNGWY
jgi:hypothetical protein